MKKAKLKQYGLAICLLASLFVSTVTACGCLHHRKQVATSAAASCHQHSEEAPEKTSSEQRENVESSESAPSVVSNDECCCIQPARKVVAKTENLKIEKQTLAGVRASRVAVAFVPRKLTVKTEFIAPFYLTDSFYNLAPGRAPPVL